MRVISFVKHLELEFEGNILKNAVCLGDIDNDGLNELIVGNEKGELVIFKGDNIKPVFQTNCAGMITAIAVGNICNIDRNLLVVITNCGVCYIFNFEQPKPNVKFGERKLVVKSIHSQQIPANIKTALIGDVNGDGYSELVVAMTDRVVRAYGWFSSVDLGGGKLHDKLIGLNKWELSDQIGTIAFNKSADGTNVLLVAQPGGTYYTLRCKPPCNGQDPDTFTESSNELLTKITLDYQPLASSRLRNQNIQTELCGNIKSNCNTMSEGYPCAVATLDGTLMLVQNDQIKWNLQVDHQLFALSSLDITGDGNEELIACAWDGNTYIVSHNTDCVRYTFPEPVNSFTAGMYGYQGKQTSSLVYVTLTGCIFLFYDIQIPQMEPITLTEVLKKDPDYLKSIEALGISVDDTVKIRDLHSQLLFNFKT